MSNNNRNSSHSIRPSFPFLENFSEVIGIAMKRQPEPVTGKLQIFQKMGIEPQARAGWPVLEYHAALVTGDLDRLKLLMDQFFQDANVVFEIKKDEMEWQVKSPATFGPSGTFPPLKPGYLFF